MIVGILALLNVLFFGGTEEYFFTEKLEKGVKTHIVEKDRSKEILLDLKETKTMIKAFNKERKSQLSEFLSMNLDRNVKRESMDSFFEDRVEERLDLQKKMIKKRLLVVSKIEDDEWMEIINLSDASIEKKRAKAQKKGSKDPFEPAMKTIRSTISDQGNQTQAVVVVENFKEKYTKFLNKVNAVNSVERNLLNDKNTTAKEFQVLANDVNQLREMAYQSFIDLHFDLKKITNKSEWAKVMKSINNIIS